MPLAIRCPRGHKLNVPSKYAGKSIRCPACESRFEVPARGARQASAQQSNARHAKAQPPADKEAEREVAATEKESSPTLSASTTSAATFPATPALSPASAETKTPPLPPKVPEGPTLPSPEVRSGAKHVPEAAVLPPTVQPNRLQALLFERRLLGTRRGYRPERKHRVSVYWLATGQALLACFAAIPAFWQMGAEQTAPWLYLVLMLSGLQLAYAVWLCLAPDFSSAQVAMFASGSIAAIYAAATAVCWLTEAHTGGWFHLGSLKMIHGNKPALWCAAVMLLASLVAYFCGHVSYRWQKTYQRQWSAKPF